MKQGKAFSDILILILGEDTYNKLITDAVHEYNKNNKYDVDDIEYILDSYMISILLIGFSKKKVDIDKYSIHFINKPDIKIDAKTFCENYKQYINQVERFKFDLLRKLL